MVPWKSRLIEMPTGLGLVGITYVEVKEIVKSVKARIKVDQFKVKSKESDKDSISI